MSERFTKGPWKFERMATALELARLQGKELETHDGYFRENDGSWIVTHESGQIARITFHGSAKRGQGYMAPDPEGQANAHLIAAAPTMYEVLEECAEFFFERADADHNGERYVPNKDMKLLATVTAALARARGEQ
jgi:hypothetical protein